MGVWREVQEAIYAHWVERWVLAPGGAERTKFALDNEAPFDPPNGPHALVETQRRPGGPGTIGSPGNRKMDRAGVVFIRLRDVPGAGVGPVSDLADHAGDVFENCRLPVHGLRFANVDVDVAALIEDGKWWGVTVEARFDYEQTK